MGKLAQFRQANSQVGELLDHFDAVARMGLLDEGFGKARELLAQVSSPRELQQWATAVAILIDRMRLEEGEATERVEVSSTGSIRERLIAAVAELANRESHAGVIPAEVLNS